MTVSRDGGEEEALWQDALVRFDETFLEPGGMGVLEVVQVAGVVRRCEDV